MASKKQEDVEAAEALAVAVAEAEDRAVKADDQAAKAEKVAKAKAAAAVSAKAEVKAVARPTAKRPEADKELHVPADVGALVGKVAEAAKE